MLIQRVIKLSLILLATFFLVLNISKSELYASGVAALCLLLLLFVYYKYTTKKAREKYFMLFLVLFTLGQLISFAGWLFDITYKLVDISYYLANILFIASYVALIIQVLQHMNLKEIVSRFPVSISILIVLDVFCVYLISATAKGQLDMASYVLEFTYNGIIMMLLSVALISYMYRSDNKSMLFLVGSIFIMFSEMIQLAYYYISDANNLNIIYSIFLVLGFLFLYFQSQKTHIEFVENYNEDQLEIN